MAGVGAVVRLLAMTGGSFAKTSDSTDSRSCTFAL